MMSSMAFLMSPIVSSSQSQSHEQQKKQCRRPAVVVVCARAFCRWKRLWAWHPHLPSLGFAAPHEPPIGLPQSSLHDPKESGAFLLLWVTCFANKTDTCETTNTAVLPYALPLFAVPPCKNVMCVFDRSVVLCACVAVEGGVCVFDKHGQARPPSP